jgi:hypothetical protein
MRDLLPAAVRPATRGERVGRASPVTVGPLLLAVLAAAGWARTGATVTDLLIDVHAPTGRVTRRVPAQAVSAGGIGGRAGIILLASGLAGSSSAPAFGAFALACLTAAILCAAGLSRYWDGKFLVSILPIAPPFPQGMGLSPDWVCS